MDDRGHAFCACTELFHASTMKTDVAVIGGGAIGAAVAYFLRLLDPAASVSVIERDPAYELASTPRASGGVRRRPTLVSGATATCSSCRQQTAACSGGTSTLSSGSGAT
jgi:succinate dehydrogenase/fumarate reductase flavoprotein subunit